MEDSNQKTYTFHVKGMHCDACVLLTESELMEVEGVTHAVSSLTTHTIEVSGDFSWRTPEEVAR